MAPSAQQVVAPQVPGQQPDMGMGMAIAPAAPMYNPAFNAQTALRPDLTDDKSIQCYFDDCRFIGKFTCRWNNMCCRSKKHGGCGQRICAQHRYKQDVVTTHHDDDHHVGDSHHHHHTTHTLSLIHI